MNWERGCLVLFEEIIKICVNHELTGANVQSHTAQKVWDKGSHKKSILSDHSFPFFSFSSPTDWYLTLQKRPDNPDAYDGLEKETIAQDVGQKGRERIFFAHTRVPGTPSVTRRAGPRKSLALTSLFMVSPSLMLVSMMARCLSNLSGQSTQETGSREQYRSIEGCPCGEREFLNCRLRRSRSIFDFIQISLNLVAIVHVLIIVITVPCFDPNKPRAVISKLPHLTHD